jgi:signal transduction histidine kinase/ActR/RegA family two-component response regulator
MDISQELNRPPPHDERETFAALSGSVLYERDVEGLHSRVTGSMRDLLGFDPTEAHAGGLAWWLSRVHEEDRHIVVGRLAGHRADRGTTWSVEYRVRRANGTWAIVRDRGCSFTATSTRPARIVGVLSDVSDARALREEVARARRLEIVARLAAGVAHDFNNVLSAISGLTSVLLEDAHDNPEQLGDLRQIETMVARGAALSNNLMGLAKPRSGGKPRLISLGDEVQRLAPTLRILMGTKVECSFDTPQADRSAFMDPSALDQVLLNLAANARDAMPDGGALGIRVVLDELAQTPRLRIEVRDTGSGMPAQVLSSVFTPYFTTKGERRGTGLGLWLVREIVEGSGGRISIDSEPNHGTCVRIELPALLEPPSSEPVPLPAPNVSTAGYTVLFIEDEEIVRVVTRRLLERGGLRVIDVGSGADGLLVLEQRRHEIDVIITDLHMAGISGPPLVSAIGERAPDVGCIVLSGLAERATGLQPVLDLLQILPKPCEPADLVRSAISMAAATVARRREVVHLKSAS